MFVQRPHVAITGLASLTVRSQQGAESHAHTEVEARGWDTKRRELFNGYRVSILQDEKSSGDWLHKSVNVLNTTELYP